MTYRLGRHHTSIGMYPRPHLQYRIYSAAELVGIAKLYAGWPKVCEFPEPIPRLIIEPGSDIFVTIATHLKRQP